MRLITEDNIDQLDSLSYKTTRYIDKEKIITKKPTVKSKIKITKDSLLDVSDTESRFSEQDELEKIQSMADSDSESDVDSIGSQETGIPEDDDESDLNPKTIESIRRAEEYASSVKDDDSDDSETENEPLNLGDDLPESELGLEDITKATDGINQEFTDIKKSIEDSNREQLDKIDELQKSIAKDKLKSQGIVIMDSDDKKTEGEKSILVVDDDDDDDREMTNSDDNEEDSDSKKKSITLN